MILRWGVWGVQPHASLRRAHRYKTRSRFGAHNSGCAFLVERQAATRASPEVVLGKTPLERTHTLLRTGVQAAGLGNMISCITGVVTGGFIERAVYRLKCKLTWRPVYLYGTLPCQA